MRGGATNLVQLKIQAAIPAWPQVRSRSQEASGGLKKDAPQGVLPSQAPSDKGTDNPLITGNIPKAGYLIRIFHCFVSPSITARHAAGAQTRRAGRQPVLEMVPRVC